MMPLGKLESSLLPKVARCAEGMDQHPAFLSRTGYSDMDGFARPNGGLRKRQSKHECGQAKNKVHATKSMPDRRGV
jgi:hypothetical protein